MIDNCGLIYTKERNVGNWMKWVEECPKEAADRMVEEEVSQMYSKGSNFEVPLMMMTIFWIVVLP